MSETKLVDRKTAAAFLGLKYNTLTVWAMSRKHNLPYIKIGKRIRYRMSDLEEFLKQNLVSEYLYGIDKI